MMYEEQVKRLRDKASKLDYDGWVDTAASLEEAANTIEALEFTCDIYEKDYKALWAYVPKWIPVTERLPEEDGMYLVHGTWSASGRKVTDTCEFYVHDGYFRAAWNFDVTHWMPLPEPPKEE